MQHQFLLRPGGRSGSLQHVNRLLIVFSLSSLLALQRVVTLDNVEYGASGGFAVNLWVRVSEASDLTGSTFSYLFSHADVDTTDPMTSPNQARC
jgi:hypothetical protein